MYLKTASRKSTETAAVPFKMFRNVSASLKKKNTISKTYLTFALIFFKATVYSIKKKHLKTDNIFCSILATGD